ncbi:MAG: phospholipase [Gemmatimonadaceae bacterium]|nr:phospholipase [Gemmatimonadaceae bacterium]
METSITEHHLAVKKTARYCVLGDLGPHTEELWVVCHGFGQLAREFLSGFDSIVTPHRVIVAPEALSRFYRSQGTVHTPETPVGATWMTSEDRQAEIDDYVGYLDILLAELRLRMRGKGAITVLGFSQGAATVSRWVANSAPAISRLILWGGLLPPELRDHHRIGGLSNQPVQFVVGTADRYFKAELVKAEFATLGNLGIDASLVQFEGGHVIEPATLLGLA